MRGVAGLGQFVIGEHFTAARVDEQQPPTDLLDPHGAADQPVGHRVAGRGEPHAGQPIDLAGHRRRPDLGPQRGQRPPTAAVQ
jgi:hypothetical protein